MKLFIAQLLLVCSTVTSVFGQFEDRYWFLGRTNSPINTTNVNLDFYPNGSALYNTAGAPPSISPPPANISSANGFEGWGVVTNPETGELLFYTDGNSVYDGDHQDITPTGGLGASPSSSQAVVISVVPVCPFNQYYIFSNPTGVVGGGSTSGPATYRIYTLGAGFSPILSLPWPNGDLSIGEGMIVIPSKTDPFTYWFIVRLSNAPPNGADYVVYQINETGISFHATFNFGPSISNNPYSPIMNMTFVDDGSTDEVIVGFSVSGSPNQVFTNTFNTTTGNFTGGGNTIASFSGGTLYDLEFSPAGNYVYYATYSPSVLYQIPTNGGAEVLMRNFGNIRGGGLKRAPDGFIYHTYDAGNINNNGAVRIGRIIQPETAFVGSNFDEMYQADFNSTVSMIYEDVFAYNFPEFANVPSWSAEILLESDDPICSGSTALINVDINSQGQNVVSYYWTWNSNFLATTMTPTLEIDEGGIYQVEVFLEGSCTFLSNQLVVEVTTDGPQIDNISTSNPPCGETNGMITIDASGGISPITYALGTGAFQASNTFSDLSPGVYQITVQDQNGCTDTEEIEVLQAGNIPEITLISAEPASCLDNDGMLSITANGGTGVLLYSINDGVDFQLEPDFFDMASGVYTVVVVDAVGCTASLVLNLFQTEDGPMIELVTTTASSCSDNDGTINIIANGTNSPLSYSIDGVNFQVEEQFTDLAPGSYLVTVKDEKGCTITQSAAVSPTSELPFFQDITMAVPSCNSADGELMVQAGGGTGNLQFSIDGFSFQNENTFSQLAAGQYLIYVQDELNCVVDSTFLIVEGRCPVYIPNVFSPNNDGVNDRFQLFSDGNPGTIIKRYVIFDRWGELIFESNDFHPSDTNRFWNGTFRGQPMENGVYVYLIEILYSDGFTELVNGDITLLR